MPPWLVIWLARFAWGERWRKATPAEKRFFAGYFFIIPVYAGVVALLLRHDGGFMNRAGFWALTGVTAVVVFTLYFGSKLWAKYVPAKTSLILAAFVWPVILWLAITGLKAYTIGSSSAAPQLDVICRPNTTMKRANTELTEGDKKRNQWRLAFWTDIHHRMKSEKLPFRLQKPGEDHWSSVAIGRAGFHLSMLLTPKNQSVVVELVIQPDGWKDSAFEQLKSQASEIQKELGVTLQWRPMLDKSSSRILLEEKIDPKTEANRKAVGDWFAKWTPKMFLAFSKRVKALSAPQ